MHWLMFMTNPDRPDKPFGELLEYRGPFQPDFAESPFRASIEAGQNPFSGIQEGTFAIFNVPDLDSITLDKLRERHVLDHPQIGKILGNYRHKLDFDVLAAQVSDNFELLAKIKAARDFSTVVSPHDAPSIQRATIAAATVVRPQLPSDHAIADGTPVQAGELNTQQFAKFMAQLLRRETRRALKAAERIGLLDSAAYAVPNQLIIAESPTHYIAELRGVENPRKAEYYSLKARDHVEQLQHTDEFFNPNVSSILPSQSPLQAAMTFASGANMNVSGVRFATAQVSAQSVLNKFGLRGDVSTIKAGSGLAIHVGGRATRVLLDNADILTEYGGVEHLRHVAAAFVARKDDSTEAITKWVVQRFEKINGNPYTCPGSMEVNNDKPLLVARQLSGYLDIPSDERGLDAFLKLHADEFAVALNYKLAKPQCVLERKTVVPNGAASLQPDYMMVRPDGFCDILDLKRAAHIEVAVGATDRRKFSAYVEHLIHQLRLYDEYFKDSANATWARLQIGIQVKEPLLIGVVGNYENFDAAEVKQLLGVYSNRLILMSYATVVSFLRERCLRTV